MMLKYAELECDNITLMKYFDSYFVFNHPWDYANARE